MRVHTHCAGVHVARGYPTRTRLFWTHGGLAEPALHSPTRLVCRHFVRVSDGTRTRDRLDHNQELYLLSYAHHGAGRG
jgi:hypothetical protein